MLTSTFAKVEDTGLVFCNLMTKMPVINLENLAFLGSTLLKVTFLNKYQGSKNI